MIRRAANHAMEWEIGKRKHHAPEDHGQGLRKTAGRDPLQNTSPEEIEQLYIKNKKHGDQNIMGCNTCYPTAAFAKPDRDYSYLIGCKKATNS